MERLTERHWRSDEHYMRCSESCYGDGSTCVGCPAFEKLVERLGEYEDAGLTPWISADERLPHFNEEYIVVACDENAPADERIWGGTAVVVAEYYNGCWTWDDGGVEYDLTGLVTHWMKFPNAPKG